MPTDTQKSDARWLAAQKEERKGLENAADIKEWLRVRRHTWASLMKGLNGLIEPDKPKKVLDIGNGPTSIFLTIREGERYAVDPNLDCLFESHPFIKDVPEYQGVHFISETIEAATLPPQFDLIFMINVLDHVSDLKPVIKRVEELLAPNGTLIVVIDCYADKAVRNIIKFFDVDIPHPHHFITQDIEKLFANFKITKRDEKIYQIFDECAFKGKKNSIELYRVDKFFGRMGHILASEGKKGDIWFTTKYMLCYGLSLLAALLRRKEKPTHPLKKLRLFVFKKP